MLSTINSRNSLRTKESIEVRLALSHADWKLFLTFPFRDGELTEKSRARNAGGEILLHELTNFVALQIT